MTTSATPRMTGLRPRERGAVLIVTLLFLVVLTMLGVTAMTSTTMEERMAGNTRDASIALQAAEAALRDARRDISSVPVVPGASRPYPVHISQFGTGGAGSCNLTGDYAGLCMPADLGYARSLGAILPVVSLTSPADKMQTAPSVEYGQFTGATKFASTGGTTFSLVRQPRYIIEGFCLQQSGESLDIKCNFFRITARGYGRSPNTQVTLQETFLAL